jgi:hypothetical protein
MGQQGTYSGSAMDVVAVRDQLRNLLSGLERFQGRAKQRFGWPVDLGMRAKQGFGRPIGGIGLAGTKQGLGRPVFFPSAGKQGFGRPVFFPSAGKQGFGRPIFPSAGKQRFGQPIDFVAGGKHGFGFGVDLVRVLQALYARLDLLGERAGMAPGELEVAAAFRGTLGHCKAGGVPKALVEQVFKDQLDVVYRESGGAKEE